MDQRRVAMRTSNEADAVIKLLLLGDGAVGKSSLLLRYCDDSFETRHILTIGVDFKSKIVDVGDERIKLQIWDTAGQERFRNITPVYFRSAMGLIIVFDVTSIESLENVTYWLNSFEQHAGNAICKVLVGNKIDVAKRQVSRRRGETLAAKHGIAYFETSALDNIGVQEMFLYLATTIRRVQIQNLTKDMRQSKFSRLQSMKPIPIEATSPFKLADEVLVESSADVVSCCGMSVRKIQPRKTSPPGTNVPSPQAIPDEPSAAKNRKAPTTTASKFDTTFSRIRAPVDSSDASDPRRSLNSSAASENFADATPTLRALPSKRKSRAHMLLTVDADQRPTIQEDLEPGSSSTVATPPVKTASPNHSPNRWHQHQ